MRGTTQITGQVLYELYFRWMKLTCLALRIYYNQRPSTLDDFCRREHKRCSCSCSGVCKWDRETKCWGGCVLRGRVVACCCQSTQICCRGGTGSRQRTPLPLSPSRWPQSLKRKTQHVTRAGNLSNSSRVSLELT